MRLGSRWTGPLVVVLIVIGCNTVDPSQCWVNASGGLGGGDTIPIGAGVGAGSGDFLTPPGARPLDFGGASNPCIMPQSPCNEKCLEAYEAAAIGCGRITNDAQRKSCQDNAYAAYKSCGANCLQAEESNCRQRCTEQAEACEAECRKIPEDDKDARRRCWEGCNNARAACYKKCK